MQVAAEGRAHLLPARGQRPEVPLQVGERRRLGPGEAVDDDGLGLRTDAREVSQRALGGAGRDLPTVPGQQRCRGATVGLDPVAVGEPALEQEGDPAEHPHRVELVALGHLHTPLPCLDVTFYPGTW